jgi:AraC-like DNA-binding protein
LRFADPQFSPVALAAKLGVSVRYVQDLLYETGMTFSDRVLELRLLKAHRMLAASAAQLKIVEIAYACGFGDISYFNRSFRRRFGVAPSGVRGQRDADS